MLELFESACIHYVSIGYEKWALAPYCFRRQAMQQLCWATYRDCLCLGNLPSFFGPVNLGALDKAKDKCAEVIAEYFGFFSNLSFKGEGLGRYVQRPSCRSFYRLYRYIDIEFFDLAASV